MESKAVWESTKAQYNRFLLFKVCEMIEFKTNIASTVPCPGLKPNCASVFTSLHCDHFNNLWFNKDVNNLPKLLIKLIPL